MKNVTILITAFAFSIQLSTAQVGMHYQGVLRSPDNEIMANASIDLRFRLYTNLQIPDQFDYEEEHLGVSTSTFGVFMVDFGSINPNGLEQLDFSKNYFIEVAIRSDLGGSETYTVLHRSSLSTMPYALHAKTAEDVDDADADPENELQTLSFDSDSSRLMISNGNSISFAAAADADADPQNELQMLSKSGNTIKLSNGGEVEDDVEDNDADPMNEMQVLTKEGNKIRLSDGGEVIDDVEDEDADPNNEIQRISRSGSKISLSKNGGEVILPLEESPWNSDPNNNVISTLGKVGIGTTDPTELLEVSGQLKADMVKADQVSDLSERYFIKLISGPLGTGLIELYADQLKIMSLKRNEIRTYKELVVGNPAQNTKFLTFNSDRPWHFRQHSTGATTALKLQSDPSNNNKNFLIDTKGSVGIDTDDPKYKLHVNGTAGKPGGGSWTNSSDRRLKTAITDYKKGLDCIKQIQPVSFRYNGKLDLPTDQTYVGVIAQDLVQVLPSMVSEYVASDGQTYLAVDPSAFDFVLINAVKELALKLSEQTKIIKRLERQLISSSAEESASRERSTIDTTFLR